eukprot:scaffold131603_cov17-Prasinocladus_malaysianus.AAC.1
MDFPAKCSVGCSMVSLGVASVVAVATTVYKQVGRFICSQASLGRLYGLTRLYQCHIHGLAYQAAIQSPRAWVQCLPAAGSLI